MRIVAQRYEDQANFRPLDDAQQYSTNSMIDSIRSLSGLSLFGESEAEQGQSIRAASTIISGQLKSLATQLKHPCSTNTNVSKLVNRGEFSFAFVIPGDSIRIKKDDIQFDAKVEVVCEMDDPSVVEPEWPTAEGSYCLTRAKNGGWTGKETTRAAAVEPSTGSSTTDQEYMLDCLSKVPMSDPDNLVKAARLMGMSR